MPNGWPRCGAMSRTRVRPPAVADKGPGGQWPRLQTVWPAVGPGGHLGQRPGTSGPVGDQWPAPGGGDGGRKLGVPVDCSEARSNLCAAPFRPGTRRLAPRHTCVPSPRAGPRTRWGLLQVCGHPQTARQAEQASFWHYYRELVMASGHLSLLLEGDPWPRLLCSARSRHVLAASHGRDHPTSSSAQAAGGPAQPPLPASTLSSIRPERSRSGLTAHCTRLVISPLGVRGL